MKIVYFGSGEFGVPTLARLATEHDLLAVVTQPDRPAGRHRRHTPTPIANWVCEHHCSAPVFKPERVSEASFARMIREYSADAWVVIAFGQKLSPGLLEDQFAINLHASLLPRWRGAAPINHAILAGDSETGNSVITLADRMDAGFILAQSRRPIDARLTAGELHDLLANDGPGLVMETLAAFASDSLAPKAQDESLVTIAGKLSKADAWVDFAAPAELCRRRIHGLTPWPGVSSLIAGESVKLMRVEPGAATSERATGTIIDAATGTVACGEGTSLRILEVHPSGKRAMTWEHYARGRALRAGKRVESGAR